MIEDLSRRFTHDDVELAWDRWGPDTGAPLVLVHGFSGSAHDFAEQIPHLARHRPVVAMDHRGHGRSTKLGSLDGYSLDLLLADLTALLEAEVGEPADVLGHSMGGRLALRLALDRPELARSLVLMDTTAWSFANPDSAIAEFMAAFMEAFDPADGLPDLGGLQNDETPLVEAGTSVAFRTLKESLSARFDPYALKALGTELWAGGADGDGDRLPELTMPTTAIAGEHDHPFVDHAPGLAEGVANGTLAVIDGAYHSPQLTHAEPWRAVVESHLSRAAR